MVGPIAVLLAVLIIIIIVVVVWFLAQRPLSNLQGKRVLITGVSRDNIGHALARCAAKNGCSELILASFKGSGLEDVVAECEQLGSGVILIDECNLCEKEGRDLLMAKCGSGIDVVVLLHVISTYMAATDNDICAALQKNFDVNLFSYIELIRAVLPNLLSTAGRLIVFSSVAATIPCPKRSAYSASKAALSSYLDCFAAENPNLDMTIVYPGMIDTPALYSEYDSAIVKANAISPNVVAEAVFSSRQFHCFVPIGGVFGALIHFLAPNFMRRNINAFLPRTKI